MKTSSQTHPVVLITGALTGIGRATAIAFAQQGARIIVSGRREEEGRKLETELRELGAEADDALPRASTAAPESSSTTSA